MKKLLYTLSIVGLAMTTLGDVISISFTESTNHVNQQIESTTLAGVYPRSNWNITHNKAGTLGSLANDLGAATTASIDWLSSNAWGDGSANTDANAGIGDAQVARGYLDDGFTTEDGGVSNGVQITVSNIPYATYTVVIHFATGGNTGTYLPAKINGSTYSTTGDKSSYFPVNNWQPYNTVVVEGLSGDLEIVMPVSAHPDRASIGGIQIAESSEGAPPAPPQVPPTWLADSIAGGSILVDTPYDGTLTNNVVDRNGDPITFSKDSGPAWLTVNPDGTLSGTPLNTDVGPNTFTISADDGISTPSLAVLEISVVEPANATISMNFAQGGNQGFSGGANIGPLTTDSANWNTSLGVAELANGTVNNLLDDSGAATAADITWTARNVWFNGTDGTGADENKLMVGYLDDGEGGALITITDIPYAEYRVYGLVSTDGSNPEGADFNVNGTWVYGGTSNAIAAVTGSLNNNNTVNGENWTEIVYGGAAGNYWVVETSGSTLTIDAYGYDNTGGANARGSIAGVIIEDISYTPAGPATVTILPVSAGTGVEISWMGEDQKLYGVETNSNLIVGDWQSYTSGIMGAGTTIAITNAIGPDQTYYRVISE